MECAIIGYAVYNWPIVCPVKLWHGSISMLFSASLWTHCRLPCLHESLWTLITFAQDSDRSRNAQYVSCCRRTITRPNCKTDVLGLRLVLRRSSWVLWMLCFCANVTCDSHQAHFDFTTVPKWFTASVLLQAWKYRVPDLVRTEAKFRSCASCAVLCATTEKKTWSEFIVKFQLQYPDAWMDLSEHLGLFFALQRPKAGEMSHTARKKVSRNHSLYSVFFARLSKKKKFSQINEAQIKKKFKSPQEPQRDLGHQNTFSFSEPSLLVLLSLHRIWRELQKTAKNFFCWGGLRFFHPKTSKRIELYSHDPWWSATSLTKSTTNVPIEHNAIPRTT